MKHLIAIQNELKAPKSRFNKFGGFFYRSCEDILEAVKPLCQKHGCLLTLSDAVEHIGDRYYITATAKLITPDSTFEVSASAREDDHKKGMDGAQLSGAASSYARKYALNGLFNIDDNKDIDTDEFNYQGEPETRKKTGRTKSSSTETKSKMTRNDIISAVVDMCDKKRFNVKDLCDKTGVDKLEDMTDEQLSQWVDWLESK